MPSISRQYHPPSCRLEITAQTSPLSRWAGRPMLKSLQFLVCFRERTGANHQPLEIRGNQEQLQLLCETVSNYVQHQLGQPFTPDALMEDSTAENASEPPIDADSSQLYLRPRSLVAHDLVLGPLSPNAEQQTISLKASQLFDLVSALDDCSTELAILPLASPRRRPPLPVWASSAAVIVLLLGLSTATLQLTQRQPTSEGEWVTASDPKDAHRPTQSAAEPETITELEKSADPDKTLLSQNRSQSPSPAASRLRTSSPPATPPASNDRQDREQVASQSSPSAAITRAPQQQAPASIPAPSLPTEPQGQDQSPVQNRSPVIDNNQPLPNQPSPLPTAKESEVKGKWADQSPNQQLQEPVAKAPSTVHPTSKTSPPAVASSPADAAKPLPKATAEISAASDIAEADGAALDSAETDSSQGNPTPQLESFNRQRPNQPETAADVPQSAYIRDIRQYLDSRWRVPTGLNQPLQYQLTLNADGSLKQLKPLNQVATQYLAQVPLPTENQPFIAPLQPSQTLQVHLILRPDGTVTVGEGGANLAP